MNLARALICLTVTALAAPAVAQMSFEGLDLGPTKKKKKGPKKAPKEATEEATEEAKPVDEAPVSGSAQGPEKSGESPKAPPQAGPVAAPAKGAESKPAPPIAFDAVDVSGKTADRQRLDAAAAQFKGDAFEAAAVAFFDLTQDPQMVALRVESEYWLGKSLYKLGMYHSALNVFSKVLARGEQSKFFKSSLEWLFFISRKTINEAVVLDEIAKYAGSEFPERFRSEFRYLLARYNVQRGKALDDAEQAGEADRSFEEVKRLTVMVPKADPFYARAKYLEGLAYFREGKPELALTAMKEVVRETRAKAGLEAAEAKNRKTLRELAFMQLARTHYGARQNRNAIFYFSRIERGGPQWLESLFEASWAHYRIGQYEQALGNLITLSSPFFREEYFPEAMILKAVIYFENCRYKEALTVIEDFENIYGPVQERLEAMISGNMEATEYFSVLSEVQKREQEGAKLEGSEALLGRILKLALTDKDLKKTLESIAELESEIDSIAQKSDAFKYSNLAKSVMEGLKVQRQDLIQKAGLIAKGKLGYELSALKTLRANGLRIKFETTSKEKEFLEAMLTSGGKAAIVKKYRYTQSVSDDDLYWPYAGEYWRDELGTYQYTLTKGCIESDSRAAAKRDSPESP